MSEQEDVMDTSIVMAWEDEGGAYVIPEKNKIIKVNTKTVKCDNDHPAVWYSLTETGFAVCGYCNIKYVDERSFETSAMIGLTYTKR